MNPGHRSHSNRSIKDISSFSSKYGYRFFRRSPNNFATLTDLDDCGLSKKLNIEI